MKRLLALLLCLVMALTLIPAAAAEEIDIIVVEPEDEPIALVETGPEAEPNSNSGSCGANLTYKVAGGVLTITGTGKMYDYEDGIPVDDSESISEIVVSSGVTSIGSYAFYYFRRVTKVTLPDTLTSIGDYAFYSCGCIPEDTEITLPQGLKTIGECAFGNSGMKSVTVPGTVTSVGAQAFGGCCLESAVLAEGVPCISENMFYDCTELTEVTVPSTVKTIGSDAFTYCESLKSVHFKGPAPSFGSDVFYGVTATAYYPAGDSSWSSSVRQNYGGKITWEESIVKPVITTQPKSVSTTADSTAKFTVKATGGSLNYQWQYRTSSSGTWHNSTSTGNKTATLSIKATEARNGYQYRCKVMNSAGYKYSGAATLTIVTKPTITTQPKSQSAKDGVTVKFTVAASGGGLKYQWYYRTSSSGEWKKSTGTGATTKTLSVEAKSYRDGYQYRCKVSNAAGYKYSSAATLTGLAKPTITTQPASKSVSAGTTVKFTVKAAGGSLSYQWYYRTSSSGEWKKCTGAGATTATLTVEAKSFRSGYQYRCKVSNELGYKYSSAATLTVK